MGGGLWALECAWHSAETNLRCTPNLNCLDLIVSEISAFIRTDGQTDRRIDSASDRDQEYIYFMVPETLSSACYILSDESSIPIYSTSNGYKMKSKP